MIDALAQPASATTLNLYPDGQRAGLLRERLAAYLEERGAATILLVAEAPGLPRHADQRHPADVRAPAHRLRPAEATATIVHRVLAELGLGRRPALEPRPDAPAPAAQPGRTAADPGRGRGAAAS